MKQKLTSPWTTYKSIVLRQEEHAACLRLGDGAGEGIRSLGLCLKQAKGIHHGSLSLISWFFLALDLSVRQKLHCCGDVCFPKATDTLGLPVAHSMAT